MAARRGRVKNKKRRGLLGRIVSFLLICAAIIAAILVFLKVNSIVVEGESRYTAEEIIDASGVDVGDNMIFISQSKIVTNIKSKLYYVNEVSVDRQYPDKLILTVNDSIVAAYIEDTDGRWLLDVNCKLLEKEEKGGTSEAPRVTGIAPVKPKDGEMLTTEDSGNSKVAYLAEILTYASKQGILDGITSINMDNAANPQFRYLDNYNVKLGAYSEVEYKIQMLKGVLEELGEGPNGVIDLSDTSRISFSPD